MTKLKTTTILTLTTLCMLIGWSESHAQSCGDTLTTNTVLTANLSCAGAGLIIGANSITLDCANFSISGSGVDIGIRLVGRAGVTIRNCLVQDFAVGFLLNASTSNVLEFNGALSNTSGGSGGFYLSNSNGNVLRDNRSGTNAGRGILLSGSSGNILLRNSTFANSFRGIDLTNGSGGNLLAFNNADQNTSAGYVVSAASSGNVIFRNSAIGNSSEGFALLAPGNTLVLNVSNGNNTYGFRDSTSGGNTYAGNTCSGNGTAASLPAGLC